MAKQTKYHSAYFAQILKGFTLTLMTFLIVLGINLVNHAGQQSNNHFSLLQPAKVAADDVTDVKEVKYVLHGVDLYGDPIDVPFNNKTITMQSTEKLFDSSIDASEYLKMSFDNGRYTFRAYYSDQKTESGKMYFRDQDDHEMNFKLVYTNWPKRLAGTSVVNIYVVYEDHQSTKPNKITLTADAQNKEPDKTKRFYTDVNGNELKKPQIYNNADVPKYDPDFPLTIGNYKFTALAMRKPNNAGTYVFSADKLFAGLRADVPIGDITYQHIYPLELLTYYGTVLSNLDPGSTTTYVYEKFANKLTIQYLDENGKPIANQKEQEKMIPLNENYSETAPEISGYTLTSEKTLTGKLSADTTITFKYKSNKVTPPTPKPGPSTLDVKPDVTPSTPEFPTHPTMPDGTQLPNYAQVQGGAVYSLKKVYLYKNANFKQSQRIASYTKKPRINRPMFVVLNYAKDNQGRLRYYVKDVNHHSKTAGKKGYITASWSSVRPVYYQSNHQQITVINPTGVYEYTNKNLTGKVKNVKQGTTLKVTKIIRHNLTTRYQLANGHYITGNRKLVTNGKTKQPQKIKVKKTIYRYNNVNFGKRTKLIKKGTVLKVKSWTYSDRYSAKKHGTMRYQVAGGYITANNKYVKVY
ncbi:DUF5776 domain-containing protein [Lentilactobacillus kefiri]|uniref:MucBP domain protein n=2 Tax=Lentilactobacillus kefiri TaxID=33962 RepID=A0A8E1RI50_LENKE|nr:DUF5776 domain-containing protein [Lentilactobacillus kefiri]KRL57719.1 MucBP domain protein [Lentilactobacillus parakefiri DSM 10551]KRM50619.1 MucBP domain protein [Lentilactobacillus kefiri DSM 20587 = JCM 5818]MCP9370079.1 MucBP domain-containing protein [Lentilactobacillus kefiri]MDH5109653.1 DUF5776 domain-containing protein [Lentilactobacillus kefiri]MDM7493894.1 DUF5776 domain-containing protein [Lentilactobacillus kefiri]